MRSNDWKLPFNLALGFHILVLLIAVFLPAIFKSKPKFADVYSVSLVNIAEPVEQAPAAKVQDPGPPKAAAKPTPPPAAPPRIKTETPPIKKEVAPVEEPPKVVEKAEKPEPVKEEPVVEPVPPKAVSLKPLKQKKVTPVKEVPPPPKKPEVDRREIQRLAEALREEEILTEKARIAREAFEQERKLLADSLKASEARSSAASAAGTASTAASGPSAARPTGSATAASPSGSSRLIENQYNALLLSHLLQFWSVPEYMQKDLTAVVALTIRQDGEVTTMEFESRSGDRMYDQFVNKTIEAAKPFPPIPPAMQKQTHEIGLRFKPGGIQ